jgi:replicative DNA helicase
MNEEQPDSEECQEEDRIVSSFELLAIIKERQETQTTPYCSLIPTLDSLIEGFHPGELITISGPTKNGKTLLSQTITKNFFHSQIISLWFTFEVPPKQFLGQFGKDLPLIYMPAKLKAASLPWLKEKIIEAQEKYNIKAVFIDHLHFLFDLMASKNTSLQIGQVIRTLKTIAIERQLVIFVMAHTGKGEGSSYHDIRDSSFVGQESDSVFMVNRSLDPSKKTEGLIIVEFHRRTGILREMVPIIKIGNFFEERSTKEEPRGRSTKDFHDQF